MSTPEKPDGPDEFMDLDEISTQQMLKALRAMPKPNLPPKAAVLAAMPDDAKKPFEPMPLDDIAEEGLLKMLRARNARKAPPTDWSFVIWEGMAAIVAPGFSFVLKDGIWLPGNSAEIGMAGRVASKDELEKRFGTLPALPSFPSAEIAAALSGPAG